MLRNSKRPKRRSKFTSAVRDFAKSLLKSQLGSVQGLPPKLKWANSREFAALNRERIRTRSPWIKTEKGFQNANNFEGKRFAHTVYTTKKYVHTMWDKTGFPKSKTAVWRNKDGSLSISIQKFKSDGNIEVINGIASAQSEKRYRDPTLEPFSKTNGFETMTRDMVLNSGYVVAEFDIKSSTIDEKGKLIHRDENTTKRKEHFILEQETL